MNNRSEKKSSRIAKTSALLLAALFAVTFCFSGCASKTSKLNSIQSLSGTTITVVQHNAGATEAGTKSLISQYEKDTGANVKYENVSGSDITKTEDSFRKSNGPDVFIGSFSDVKKYYNNNWLYDFTDLYDQKSRYELRKTWEKELPTAIADKMYMSTGGVPGYPVSADYVRIYYNKNIMYNQKLKVPKTWKDFIQVCSKLHSHGITAFAFPNKTEKDKAWAWFNDSISNQLTNGVTRKIDLNGNNYVDVNELSAAYNDGKLNASSSNLKTGYRLMKNFSKYWENNSNEVSSVDAENLFASGKAAMTVSTSSRYGYLSNKVKDNFNFGVMKIPVVTTASAPSAMGESVVILNDPSFIYSINKDVSVNKQHLAATIDFVRYMPVLLQSASAGFASGAE